MSHSRDVVRVKKQEAFMPGIISTRLLILALTCIAPVAVGPAPAPPLHVVVYNYAGVNAADLAEARAGVLAIYRDIGVDVVWHDVAPATFLPFRRLDRAAESALAEGALVVNLLSPAMEQQRSAAPGVMGLAIPTTRTAWILTSRVRTMARECRTEPAQLLGVVIAHEMGHLVLPRHEHSIDGLMRASLTITAANLANLRFDLGQADMIRSRLAQSSVSASSHK